MDKVEYSVSLYDGLRKVGGFVTQDMSRVKSETTRWASGGEQHSYRVEPRYLTVDQASAGPIPADEYLCQAS